MMKQQKFKEICPKHPQEKIEFMRINYSNNSKESQPFFCCSSCMNQDVSIKLEHYQSIRSIMKSNPNEIIRKWPPIQNYEIIDSLIEKTQGKASTNDIIIKVISFFSDLKQQLIESIDQQQKKMIQIAESIPQSISQTQIIKQYQEISKIEELKKELLNINSTFVQKENICKELIQQSQSEQNTLQLQTLLNNLSQNILFDNQSALIEQQSILNSINKINLFQTIPQEKHILNLDVKLIKTEFSDGIKCLEINQNNKNQPTIINLRDSGSFHNAVSDLILDQNARYIFKFQIDNLQKGETVYLGLIQDKNKDIKGGWEDNLYSDLAKDDKKIHNAGDCGIEKHLIGNTFELSKENQVEMRIHIKENILELLDFPNYSYKIGLNDENIPILINSKDLRLYLGLGYENSKITLIDAQIVENFD